MRSQLQRRTEGDAALSLQAMRPADPGRYGRVIGRDGEVERIVEWADASPDERDGWDCAMPACCAPPPPTCEGWLAAVRADNAKGEHYLTELLVAHWRVRDGEAGWITVEAPEAELRRHQLPRYELADAEATVQSWLRHARRWRPASL